MVRVLVVEDSPTARELLISILSSDPEMEVVGAARDGVEAVAMTRKLRPDIVTMDIRMPRMDGFEATKEIMIASPTPIVIVTASVMVHDVETSMHALRAGALAVLEKPAGPAAPDFEESARNLIANVKAMSQVKVVRHWRPRKEAEPRKQEATARAKVVAIATSTGGPAALNRLLAELPGDFPLPILVVQHITRGFIGGLADWLNKSARLHVKVAEQGETLSPHVVYLAPDNFHLGVTGSGIVALSNEPPRDGFRPSGSSLFESAARAYGSSVLALILTGMGDDGVEGLRTVRRAGGHIIAQDEGSSVIFGMPGAAIASGLADVVLALDDIPAHLMEAV